MSHAYIHNIVAAGSLEMMVRGPGPPAHAVRVRPVVIDAAWVHSEREEGKARAKKVKSASISSGGLTDLADAMGCHIGSAHEPHGARRGSSKFAVNY